MTLTATRALVALVLAQPIAVALDLASVIGGVVAVVLGLLTWALLRHVAQLDGALDKLTGETKELRERIHALEKTVAVLEDRAA